MLGLRALYDRVALPGHRWSRARDVGGARRGDRGLVYVALMRRMTGESVLAAVLVTIALGILVRGADGARLVDAGAPSAPGSSAGPTPRSRSARRAISARRLALAITAARLSRPVVFLRYTALGHPHARRRTELRCSRRSAASTCTASTRSRGGSRRSPAARGHADRLRLRARADDGDDRAEGVPAALVGGLDSLLGALLGSLIVAAAEVLLIHYVDPLLSDVVPFFVLLAMLIVRPWGLFGTREELDRV